MNIDGVNSIQITVKAREINSARRVLNRILKVFLFIILRSLSGIFIIAYLESFDERFEYSQRQVK